MTKAEALEALKAAQARVAQLQQDLRSEQAKKAPAPPRVVEKDRVKVVKQVERVEVKKVITRPVYKPCRQQAAEIAALRARVAQLERALAAN